MEITTERTNEIRYFLDVDEIGKLEFHDDNTCNLTIKPKDFNTKELAALLKEMLKFKELFPGFKKSK